MFHLTWHPEISILQINEALNSLFWYSWLFDDHRGSPFETKVYLCTWFDVCYWLKKGNYEGRAEGVEKTCSFIACSYEVGFELSSAHIDVVMSELKSIMKMLNFHMGPILAFGYCRCLRLPLRLSILCVNLGLICMITWHPFNLESPNVDWKSKTSWLRSLLFWGLIDLDLQGKIWLENPN